MYLYVFRNLSSNKLYLGQTSQDIQNYLGSGKYWKNHCATHGGYDRSNIEIVWYHWYDCIYEAYEFLSDFEEQYSDYWNSSEWCNLIPETLEKSPLKGNMSVIFEKHGNPFSGGDIQRKAHAEGKHNYDRSETGRKSWKNRSKQEMQRKIQPGYQKWMKDNKEQFLVSQKRKAHLSRLVRCKRIRYDGTVYLGWRELKESTGISKHMFVKYNMGEIL